MAKDKKSFILYCDQKGVWDKLDDAQAGKLIKHIIAYVNDENPQAPDFITELAFEPIKQQLKRDLKEWEQKRQSRSIAGKAGADARWHSMANDGKRISDMAKMAVNVNDNVNVNVNVNDRIICIGSDDNNRFVIIQKYINDPIYKVFGVSGMKELLEMHKSKLPQPEYAEKFLRDKDGNKFDDWGHLLNSYKLFIKDQFR